MSRKILAYKRENGALGIRNYVAIIPVDDLSNNAAESVAKIIEGTIALSHPYGRLQFGKDLDLHFRTLIGNGSNPNVAAAVIIGIEPKWAKKVADGIAETGKPVAYFGIEGHGLLNTIERAARKAKEFVQYATAQEKIAANLADLLISFKCGESDTTSGLGGNPTAGRVAERLVAAGGTVIMGETSETTGAEHILAEHFATKELSDKYLKIHRDYLKIIEESGEDLLGSQPTEGNIAGGLTTIEEKALGNIQKAGRKEKVLIQSVLDLAEKPKSKGLHFMDSSSAAAEYITLMGAAGAALHLFITGQGNIVGNPIVPVVKITANPKTAVEMEEHIDVDVSGLLTREIDLDKAADKVLDVLAATARGRFTAAEALGQKEFVLTRLYPSA